MASCKANENAKKANLPIYIKKGNAIYERSSDGLERFIKELPLPLHPASPEKFWIVVACKRKGFGYLPVRIIDLYSKISFNTKSWIRILCECWRKNVLNFQCRSIKLNCLRLTRIQILPASYHSFLKDISQIYEVALGNCSENCNKAALYSNWKIGELIVKIEQTSARCVQRLRYLVNVSSIRKTKTK